MNILADATLPGLDAAFPYPFVLKRFSSIEELIALLPDQDILLCRSTLKVNRDLIKAHRLLYVATASSGTDHLDHSFLKEQNIHIVDAKGANASAVADYVLSSLAYVDQQHLLQGKQAGIIGMGEVGTKVFERLQAAGFTINSYDPLKAKQAGFQSCRLEALFNADVLCIHAELHQNSLYPSVNLLNDTFLARLKPGCILINAARGGIVNEQSLLNNSRQLHYCTDVYLNEPAIDQDIIKKATLCTPHIAGHSLEAKWAAVTMVSEKLHRLADLPVPPFKPWPTLINPKVHEAKTWQEIALSIYNPIEETLALKQAQDKKNAFLQLRKNHNTRHDFSVYAELTTDENTRLLLGCIK